jgi:hypothetical protein
MTDFDKAFVNLQKVGAKITYRRGTIPPKLVKKELRPAYANLCANYKNTTVEQRIDTYVFFETRDNLLEELAHYAGDTAQQVSKHLQAGKPDLARACVEQAVAADLIIDGRTEPNLTDETQKHITQAITEAKFNLEQYAGKLDLNASTFTKAAVRLQAQDEPLEALEALGIALQMKPELANHPKVIDMATQLTGKPANAAIALLRDPFERTLFVDEQVRLKERKNRRHKQRESQKLKPNFWLVTIGGTVFLAAFPVIALPLVFGSEPNPSSPPPGLVVGVLGSASFLMRQLRERNKSMR